MPTPDLVVLRPAESQDSALLYEWRNDPWILSLGTEQRPVTRAEHDAWFDRVLERRDQHRLLIVVVSGEPVGQMRFDRSRPDECVVSIYLVRSATGKGHGVEALRNGSRYVLCHWHVSRIVAHVQETNKRSIVAFERAGYRRAVRNDTPKGHATLVLAHSGPDDRLASLKDGLGRR